MFHIVLQNLIYKNKINQRELADRIEVSTAIISDWINNKKTPKMKYIIALANYFNVSTDYLLTGKNYKFNDEEMLLIETYRKMDATEKNIIKLYIEKYNS